MCYHTLSGGNSYAAHLDYQVNIPGSYSLFQSPVRQWLIKDIVNVRHEKSHVYLDLGGVSTSPLDFKAASKQEAVAIFYKIQKSRITHHITSPASTSLVRHSMSVPTFQTAQESPNASTSCTCRHAPKSDVPTAPSSTSVPAPTHALATRPVRIMSSRCRCSRNTWYGYFGSSLTFTFIC